MICLRLSHDGELLTEGAMKPLLSFLFFRQKGQYGDLVVWRRSRFIRCAQADIQKENQRSYKPARQNVNLDLVDEVGYRAVSIGFPVFTLGALVFAMIWAQLAWTRFGAGTRRKYGR